MFRLRNIAMRDYQDSVTTGHTHTRTDGRTDEQADAGQSDPYVPLCLAGDTKIWGTASLIIIFFSKIGPEVQATLNALTHQDTYDCRSVKRPLIQFYFNRLTLHNK